MLKRADYFWQNRSFLVHRTSVQETDREEVFVEQNSEESETAEVSKDGEDDALESTRTDEQATQEHRVSVSQVSKRS